MRVSRAYPLEDFAADVNCVAAFLALCDLPPGATDRDALRRTFGADQADVLVLLGNSVLATAENAFAAMQAGAARRLMIVGGRGHSTAFLTRSLRSHRRYAAIATDDASEAELLAQVATRHWRIAPERMLLETASTNCGENALFALRVLQDGGVDATAVILMQDPTMQRRTDATFRKVWRDAGLRAKFANDPTWMPELLGRDGELEFANGVTGCWPVERFVSLVMGEVPRLRDDAAGYGPRGCGWIEHVELPETVLTAHARLAAWHPELVRPALPDARAKGC